MWTHYSNIQNFTAPNVLCALPIYPFFLHPKPSKQINFFTGFRVLSFLNVIELESQYAAFSNGFLHLVTSIYFPLWSFYFYYLFLKVYTIFQMWPNDWSFSFNISPSNEYKGLISFRMDWLDLLAVKGTVKSLLQHHSSKASIL